MNSLKQLLYLMLVIVFTLSSTLVTYAVDNRQLSAVIDDTAKYMLNTVTSPTVGSVGGEWAVMGLARSGYPVPQNYYETYYKAVENHVRERKGVLHEQRYTDYSRVILALTAIGKDPSNVAGYNLLSYLGDYEKVIWQGVNGPIYAILALDSGNYEMPVSDTAKTQASRYLYVNYIISKQLPDGGFSLTDTADPDLTAMALQALAKYRNMPRVRIAIEKALDCLSKMQNSDGGFTSWQTDNSESASQVLLALSELGISVQDKRFVKNGNTVLDNLLSFNVKGSGFQHDRSGSGSNLMATEQAFYALVGYQRFIENKNSLYTMTDAK